MPLQPGQALGHYAIIERIGAGGMGEVWLAEDKRLARKVALKLLPGGVASDLDQLRRFEREARAASGLNHPNILTIHEIGEHSGTRYIAAEFVDGATLRDILNRQGAPDFATLLDTAIQVASALSAAHEAGIVHRDVKPENIMVRRDGIAKVLDFGLAKVDVPVIADADGRGAATFSLTVPGMVLGTAAYMSPEQACGRELDHRSDIFSFGAVLYEMAAACRPFSGGNIFEVISEIVKSDPPPLVSIRPGLPPDFYAVVARALRKDPNARFESMAVLLARLRTMRRALDRNEVSATQIETVPAPRPARRWLRYGLPACAAALAIAAFGAWRLRAPALPPPEVTPFTVFAGSERNPSFSPDGNQVAFAWDGETGENVDIYVKQVGTDGLLRLTTGPEIDSYPVWSPDGRFVAFTRQVQGERLLFFVPSLGGIERRVAALPGGPACHVLGWLPSGNSLLALGKPAGQGPFRILLADVRTGDISPLTSPPHGWVGDMDAAVSPDGENLAFVRQTSEDVSDIYVAPVAGGEPKRLTFDNARAGSIAWTPDGRSLLFVSTRNSGGFGLWRMSASGGAPSRIDAVGQRVSTFAVAPRGNRLAWTQNMTDTNLWRLDLGPEPRKKTPLVSSTQMEYSAQLSPDGKKMTFVSDRTGGAEVWTADADGRRERQITRFNRSVTGSPRWSPDGKWIVFDSRAEGNADVYVVDSEGGAPRRITSEPSEDMVPGWSREGRWIYFCSNRSGSLQIWKVPAPGGGTPVQVTYGGGFESEQSPDGRFLYYSKGRDIPGIWRVPAAGGEETPVLDRHRAGFWRFWTVTPKGLYYVTAEDRRRPIIEFFDFATGSNSLVATLDSPLMRVSGLSVSPDDRWLLYTHADQVGSDIMLMENFR